MPEPKYSSADVPDFSTYPASTSELPEHASHVQYGYARRAQYSRYDQPSALDESARKIGWTIGRLVGRLEELAEQAQERFQNAQDQLQEQVNEAPDEARRTLDTASTKAQRTLNDLRYNAARLRRRAVQDYPLQVILAAGAFGILAGFGLRAWRESRG